MTHPADGRVLRRPPDGSGCPGSNSGGAVRRPEPLLSRLLRAALAVALRLTPARHHTVVYGWGDDEGNALEVLRELSHSYDGRVYWLVDSAPTPTLLERLAPPQGPPPVLVVRRTYRALVLFLLAEAVFHTHGLFTSPHPGRRKTHVSLWHGDGPKRIDNASHSIAGSFSYVVAGTQLWGQGKLDYFGGPSSRLLVVGNPRIDQFDRPASDASLTTLGIDPGRPFVLWMPTFRTATLGDDTLWSDSPSLLLHPEVQALRALLTSLPDDGVQLVVKAHPLDADAFHELGVAVLRSGDLQAAGCGLYQLLARSQALVTDYSSVWTDYLVLDRPVMLFCPDLAAYERARAFSVPVLHDVAPGLLGTTAAELVDFLREQQDGLDPMRVRRHEVAREIGAVTTTGASRRLLGSLSDRGAVCLDATRAKRALTAPE